MNIEELFQDFDLYAEKSKNQLTGMLAVISEGKVPSRESVSQLDLSIANLRVKYESVVQAASSQLDDDEMPNENASAVEYLEAFKNSKSLRLKQQIEYSKECLQKFIRVRSLVAQYTEALSPFQAQALDLLQTLSSENNIEIDDVEKATASHKVFLAAIECHDNESDEGIALFDQVAEYYPIRIYTGVVTNKYYIDNTITLDDALDLAKTEVEPQSVVQESLGNRFIPNPIADELQVNSVDEESAQNYEDNSIDAPDDKKSATTISDFVEALTLTNLFDTKAEFGVMDVVKNPAENKKITSKEFRNEMKDGDIAAEKIIIKALDKRNVVTESYLTETKGVPSNVANSTLAFMLRKGYLRKYSIIPGGEFYCASSRLQTALSFMDASKFAGIKQRPVDDWGKTIDDKASSVASRVSFSKLYVDSVGRLSSMGVKSYTSKIYIAADSFCGKIFDANNTSDCEIFAGAFWEDSLECDEFYKNLYDFVSSCKGITTFIFAAWTLNYAKSVMKTLLSIQNKRWISTPIYLYVLSEDKYYIYPELIQITKEDIAGASDTENSCPENHCITNNDSVEEENKPNTASCESSENSNSKAAITDEKTNDGKRDNPKECIADEESADSESTVYTESSAHEIDASTSTEVKTDAEKQIPLKSTELQAETEDTIRRLVESPVVPTDEELFGVISDILNAKTGNELSENSYIAQALLLGKAASYSPNNTKCRALYRQLSLATKSPLEDIVYTSEILSNELSADSSEAIILASYLFGLLIPGAAYDYSLKVQSEEYLRSFEDYFPSLSAVKPLFAKLNTVRDVVPFGFSEAVLTRLGSDTESENYVKSIQAQARNLLSVSAPKTRMKALPTLYSACFGKGSDLYSCLEIVSKNDVSEVELVKIALIDYCDVQEGNLIINDKKIDQKLDNEWFKVNGMGSSFQLEYAARQQALRQMNNRLSVIKAWAENVSVVSGGKYDFGRLRILRDEIVKLADKACADISNAEIEYKTVIVWALKTISKYLTAPLSATSDLFVELAYTGVISLNDKMKPILPEDLDSVMYYEPWRTVLRHILSPVKSLEEAKEAILDGGEKSDLFDNLHQLEIIGNLTGEQLMSSEVQIGDARNNALGNSKAFDDALELAFTYNRISETEKENLAAIKRQHEEAFFERKDFGIWRQFLRALEKRIEELTKSRQAELQRMLDARYAKASGKESPILKEAQLLLNEDLNFAVTEEYINRFDNGEEDFSEELQSVLHETDHFSEFISEEVFNPIYNECYRRRENNFHSVAREYLSKNFPSDWTARLKDDSLRFVGKEPKNDKYWPNRKDTTTPGQMVSLFSWLGMNVAHAEKINYKSEEMFKLDVTPSPRSMADYRHPISLFGTQAKSQMNVVVLQGNIPAKQLVDKITGLGLGGMSIVILNYPINLAVRRQISEEFHKTTGQNPFILIDQTLVIYLALHQITERLPIMLKCTLPYTTYQPFVRDGGSTADEMFFGRSKELATIIDPNGACVVYGGRQLGKTALLERAESLCYKPENHAYAVYCNILTCTTEESMALKIAEDVQKKTGFKFQNCKTIKELCNEFEKLFLSGKMESMLLLLDETDKFLGAIAEQDYAQLQPLIDLKRSTKNSFKFVLAGLHNVCRAKNATARNGVFGQLGTPLCVKPLSPTDALQLLSRPLRYLGFQIDRYPHLETILTNTNYYPGILQFFGYMLVETLSTHYGKYYRAVDGNPPYTLQDEQLGAVMNSADLNRSIRDKFRWSLELDQRYFMIARCIAVLYYLSEESTNTWLGFSIGEIMDIASSYDIHCLEKESENDYKNLLDEMVEMGILSKPNTEKDLYRLRRSSFINIIGSDFEAVDADISKNNLEVE